MAEPLARCPTGEHLSELVYDRLLAGEAEGLRGARQHLDACTDCRAKFEALQHEQHLALERVPQRVEQLMQAASQAGVAEERRHGSEGWGQWLGRWLSPSMGLRGAVAAAAVVALVWVVLPSTTNDDVPGGDVVRLKGDGTKFAVLRIDGDRAETLNARDSVAPGTRLGFRAQCPAGCWALLLVLDADGRPTILEGDDPAPWQLDGSGQPALLPVQVELDDRGTEERFIALFCRAKPKRQWMLDALGQVQPSAGAGVDGGAGQRPESVHGCVVRQRVVLRKGASDDR